MTGRYRAVGEPWLRGERLDQLLVYDETHEVTKEYWQLLKETFMPNQAKNSVVLASGGTDSTLALVNAMHDNPGGEVHMLSILYGQKHKKEIEAAHNIYLHYANIDDPVIKNGSLVVAHRVIDMGNPFAGADSTLIDFDKGQPQLSYLEILESEGPSPTVVPFRNANLISIATAYAIINGCGLIYVGMHATDAHNWAYPDCTPEFLGAMANAIYVGSYQEVRLVFPLIWMHKVDVIKQGYALGIPFELTWSCYEGREKHCGLCPTCIERIEGFRQLGVADPVPYEVNVRFTL